MTQEASIASQYVLDFTLRLGDDEIALGPASWADWDQRGRFVLAREGRLFQRTSAGELIEIADFNDQQPEPAPAPAWARTWPPPPA